MHAMAHISCIIDIYIYIYWHIMSRHSTCIFIEHSCLRKLYFHVQCVWCFWCCCMEHKNTLLLFWWDIIRFYTHVVGLHGNSAIFFTWVIKNAYNLSQTMYDWFVYNKSLNNCSHSLRLKCFTCSLCVMFLFFVFNMSWLLLCFVCNPCSIDSVGGWFKTCLVIWR